MSLTLPSDSQLDQLIHDSDPEVLIAVAGDARLNEDLALALLERRDLPRQALEQMHKHKSLARLRKVQLALVMLPHTPRHVSIPIIRHLYAFELMRVALLPSVVADVKRAAEETLIGRLATVSPGRAQRCAAQRATGAECEEATASRAGEADLRRQVHLRHGDLFRNNINRSSLETWPCHVSTAKLGRTRQRL